MEPDEYDRMWGEYDQSMSNLRSSLQSLRLWTVVGVLGTVGVLVISLGPALRPRAELSDASWDAIGPGLVVCSAAAWFGLRRVGRLVDPGRLSRVLGVISWLMGAFCILVVVGTCRG